MSIKKAGCGAPNAANAEKIPGRRARQANQVIDSTFDELDQQGKLDWTNESTPFSFPCFVVYRGLEGKGRVVVDIRGLNAITQPDTDPLPLQSDIILAVHECSFIFVIDCASFFYQ